MGRKLSALPTVELELQLAQRRAAANEAVAPDEEQAPSTYELELELQRRALEASRNEIGESRDRYARVYDLAPIGYVTMDPSGVVREANVAAAALLGLERSRLPGWPLLGFTEPASKRALLVHLHRCRQLGEASCELALRGQGRTVNVELYSTRALTRAGGEEAILTALIDVSARKRAEEAVRLARDQLERRVRQRTAELERVNRRLVESVERGERLEVELRARVEELAQSDRRKDEFLAMLAHELRNPLAPIVSAAEVLRIRGGDTAAVDWARSVVARQVQHLRRLVDDLLDLSRITTGKFAIAREPVLLGAVIERAVELARPVLEGRRHKLTLPTRPAQVVVSGDAERLTQAVANLLLNAAKYTAEGGVVQVEAGEDGAAATVRVTDTGEGMDAELLARVFEPFQQGGHSLAREGGGLGIGLTLVRRIVELHGGSVSAHSAGRGRGSTFELRLPRDSSGEAALRKGPEAPPSPAAAPRKVLVVDDNVDAAETLARVLEIEGHETRTAHNADEAVAAAADFGPDVALLDIGLPGVDGYQLAARLRKLPATRETLLVAVTGYGRREDFARSSAAGFDHHLVKPVDPARLGALVAAARH